VLVRFLAAAGVEVMEIDWRDQTAPLVLGRRCRCRACVKSLICRIGAVAAFRYCLRRRKSIAMQRAQQAERLRIP
jgi:hypothetical protein